MTHKFTQHICETCTTKSIVFIPKPMSKKDIKENHFLGFHICAKCEPVMASFVILDDGFEQLRDALAKSRARK